MPGPLPTVHWRLDNYDTQTQLLFLEEKVVDANFPVFNCSVKGSQLAVCMCVCVFVCVCESPELPACQSPTEEVSSGRPAGPT